VRPLLALVACVAAGLAAGGIWTLAQSDRFRADARILVRPAAVRPAVEALAESSLVAANVAQTLRLSSPPDITASRGDGGVLTVSVEEGTRERARQVDAEAIVILTQTVQRRFDASGVTATVLDPAHAAEQTSPTPWRNVLVTGLIGLLAGVAAAAAFASRRAPPVAGAADVDPRVERRLRKRLDEVAKRERALARRAGELAAREQELERRERGAAIVPQAPPPEPEPQPEQQVAATASAVATNGWNLEDLRARVEAHAADFPERADEWRSYLFFLREHARSDGTLPHQFDVLVNDVFGPLTADLGE
jgi:hypothetical protein